MTTYITASELARELGIPLTRITAALESGTIAADGRTGSNKNAAFIFAASRLAEIQAALNGGKPATEPAHPRGITRQRRRPKHSLTFSTGLSLSPRQHSSRSSKKTWRSSRRSLARSSDLPNVRLESLRRLSNFHQRQRTATTPPRLPSSVPTSTSSV
jgi:hypothetical protein